MLTNLSAMTEGKEQIARLAEIMIRKGIRNVVVSPGSRNAPVVILFSRYPELKLVSVADERSAGFFALGMAQRLNEPVAVLCTSGSAAINYGPAISEAFYQKVPMFVITADRPPEWIDQGDGQTIRQQNLFANYIRKSYQLPSDTETPQNRWYFDRQVSEAADRCVFPVSGPVHVNLPLAEPLYNLENTSVPVDVRSPGVAQCVNKLSDDQLAQLADIWNSSSRKMVIAGQLPPGHGLDSPIRKITNDPSVILLTETTSNLEEDSHIRCIDRVIEGISGEMGTFQPEILLTFGGAIVSKKIKALLRKYRPAHHWHVSDDPDEFHLDTYQSLTLTLPVTAESFLSQFAGAVKPGSGSYFNDWVNRKMNRKERHGNYLGQLPWCDMKAYEVLFRGIPAGSHVHLSNSTPVRYAQLFDQPRSFRFWSNRGTSGIDGCVSTAAGAALATNETVTVITGDIGFFYDSNALWNHHLTPNLKIIMVNNGGGNIFRILPGPDKYPVMGPFLETAHSLHADGLASNFGLDYFVVSDEKQLAEVLPSFYAELNRPALLEICTPSGVSAETLKNYFKYLIS